MNETGSSSSSSHNRGAPREKLCQNFSYVIKKTETPRNVSRHKYSQGVGQAREIAGQMLYEPALRWLAGKDMVSLRTPSGQRGGAGVREEDGRPTNQELYGKRGLVAEFPHAWWKHKFQLRQFHVRGKMKVGIEMRGTDIQHSAIDPAHRGAGGRPRLAGIAPTDPSARRTMSQAV